MISSPIIAEPRIPLNSENIAEYFSVSMKCNDLLTGLLGPY